MHIIPFCVKIALSTTHIAVCISHNSKYCARMLYTRMLTRQFFNDSCHTSRVSNMQHSSKIKHAAQLGHRTCNTSRISNTCNQSVRWIAQMINPNFWPVLNERHNARIIRNAGFMRNLYARQVLHGTAMRALYETPTQWGFCTEPLQYRKFSTTLYGACRNI